MIVDDSELRCFVLDVLCLGPKHLVRDTFNDLHFLSEIEKIRESR